MTDPANRTFHFAWGTGLNAVDLVAIGQDAWVRDDGRSTWKERPFADYLAEEYGPDMTPDTFWTLDGYYSEFVRTADEVIYRGVDNGSEQGHRYVDVTGTLDDGTAATMTLWFDDADRVVCETTISETDGKRTYDTTRYTWDAPVTITPPPADKIEP